MALALEMRGITKYFASSEVLANESVDFAVEARDVHALVGENGAGKTTLMNILYGLVKADAGELFLHGQKVTIGHPDDAIRLGIGMVHQHFKLVPSFTVAQNIMLGMEPNRAGLLRQRDENRIVADLAQKYGLPVEPTARVRDLPVSMQQRVEILKALQRQVTILILDEPTAVLTPQEVGELMRVVRGLSTLGYTVIFITHKLVEVSQVADKLSVMRGGRMIGTRPVADTTIPEMARMMVGRDVVLKVEKPATAGEAAGRGQPVFEARNITVANVSDNGLQAISQLSLKVHEGEILGVAGVSGNGQTELVEAIAGMQAIEGGQMLLLGQPIGHLSIGRRRRLGMAHIPEDRIHVGLNLHTTLDENLIVSRYKQPQFNRLGFLLRTAMRHFARTVVDRFSIMAARPGGTIATLSGGNMQKVVVGRELSGNPKFILANQPTRGLDVGSIEFVHQTLLAARQAGAAILLVSGELDEIMALSDRIIVLFRGQIQGEVPASTATEEEIGLLMAGWNAQKDSESATRSPAFSMT